MTKANPRSTTDRAVSPQPNGRVVFWLLVLMGLSAFAPCVILPEWREYQALRVAEQMEQHKLDVLQRRVAHEQRLLEAMRSDPTVIGRFAQRDLGFQRRNERVIRVSFEPAPRAVDTTGEVDAPFVPQPVQPPLIVRRVLSHLPDYDYDQIFCDDRTRPMVIGMSVALIGVAFGLFGRRGPVQG